MGRNTRGALARRLACLACLALLAPGAPLAKGGRGGCLATALRVQRTAAARVQKPAVLPRKIPPPRTRAPTSAQAARPWPEAPSVGEPTGFGTEYDRRRGRMRRPSWIPSP